MFVQTAQKDYQFFAKWVKWCCEKKSIITSSQFLFATHWIWFIGDVMVKQLNKSDKTTNWSTELSAGVKSSRCCFPFKTEIYILIPSWLTHGAIYNCIFLLCPTFSPGYCHRPGAWPQPHLCPRQLLPSNRGPAGWSREEPKGLIHVWNEKKRALLHCQSSTGVCGVWESVRERGREEETVWTHQ